KRLPEGHDQSEDDCTESGDGVEDEQLAGCGTDREEETVAKEGAVGEQKTDGGQELALMQQGYERKEDRVEVDRRHHVDGRNAVVVEQGRLPVRGERVEGKVECQNEQTGQERHPHL